MAGFMEALARGAEDKLTLKPPRIKKEIATQSWNV